MRADVVCFVLLGIVWGSNFLFMKEAAQVIEPLQVSWLRALFGALPITLFAWSRGELSRAHLRHARHFVAMALLSVVLPYVGFVQGSAALKSGAAGAISGIVPLLTAVFAAVALPDDRVDGRKALGLVLGLLGVAWVANVGQLIHSPSSQLLRGTSFMLLGCVGYAGGMVYARRHLVPLALPSSALATYQTGIAAFVLTLITPWRGLSVLSHHPLALAALVLGLGLFGTGVAFLLYFRIIKGLGAVTAASVFYLPPVVALTIGATLAHEGLTLGQIGGTSLILLGVFLAKQRRVA